jgi:hypothetical protein
MRRKPMPIELQTALISAVVALITALFGGYLTWNQIQRERRKWLVDLKTAYSLELYKTRLASYPRVFEIIEKLSQHRAEPVTQEKAKLIAQELSEWFYSTGGMCADSSTRGAIRGLRDSCFYWGHKGGQQPSDLYQWRNAVVLLLRRDLDLRGLETFDFAEGATLFKRLQEEIDSMK